MVRIVRIVWIVRRVRRWVVVARAHLGAAAHGAAMVKIVSSKWEGSIW